MNNERVEKLVDLLKIVYSSLDCFKQTIENGLCTYKIDFEMIIENEKSKVAGGKVLSELKKDDIEFYDRDINLQKELIDIINEIRNCTRCELSLKRINTVPGIGPIDSKVMIIGEAPGEQEDIQGLPFVGKAGQLLTKLLDNAGLQRDKIYITNCIKCRPPNNRVPSVKEMILCSIHLKRQINLIKPDLILSLGATSIQFLLNKKVSITKIRGTLIEAEIFGRKVLLFPTFHPSFLLRDNRNIPVASEDIKKIASYIKKNKLL
ncbi:MAG: uracil-DNA glycosylase [Exilispira sp.]